VKVVVDALCAEYGGIRTYVEQLLSRWATLEPEDEVHVAVRAGSSLPTPGLVRHELTVPVPDVLARPLVQATRFHALVRELRPDVVLATAPTTDVRRPAAPLAVVILDLRFEVLPDEFSLGRRVLRRVSYGRSYRLADAFLAISQRSLDDLHRLHPRTSSVAGSVTHLGADHVLDWPRPTREGPAIAFAHHSNKNPELLLDGWAELLARRAGTPDLLLLGVGASLRASLEARIRRLGLEHRVTLAPFLPEAEFRRTCSRAALVAFPSSFEGFGLPIVEGMLLGKPVLIGPDPGCLEVAGGHASVMTDWNPGALADAAEQALDMSDGKLAEAQTWASSFTWENTVQRTRAALAALVAAPSGSGRSA
jgi:glycosyltransferase involved in cell wall biosynthesis